MMKKVILNFCRSFVVLLLSFVAIGSYAQSADKLFMEGQNLQQTMTPASQQAAIKKFQSAKVIYTTADKKKMCDNQIAICNKNIAALRKGSGNSGKKQPEPVAVVEEAPKFSLSQSKIDFDGSSDGKVNVMVDAATMEWKFTVPAGVDGSDNFLKVTRSSDAKSIDIAVDANPKTLEREQVVNVVYGDLREVITVRQGGKPVTLSTDSNVLEFGAKGGKKSIEIYTNSDSIIASNNDLTWYIESKPDWIETSVEVKKRKGIFGKITSAIKETVAGSASAASEEGVKISNVKVSAQPLLKTDPAFNSGRQAEIVFASQDKRYRVIVSQSK